MTAEISHPFWLDAIGMIASAVALCSAIYIQIFIDKKVKPRYVLGFLGIALGFFLLTFRIHIFPVETTMWIRASGYAVFIALELVGLKIVVAEASTPDII